MVFSLLPALHYCLVSACSVTRNYTENHLSQKYFTIISIEPSKRLVFSILLWCPPEARPPRTPSAWGTPSFPARVRPSCQHGVPNKAVSHPCGWRVFQPLFQPLGDAIEPECPRSPCGGIRRSQAPLPATCACVRQSWSFLPCRAGAVLRDVRSAPDSLWRASVTAKHPSVYVGVLHLLEARSDHSFVNACLGADVSHAQSIVLP